MAITLVMKRTFLHFAIMLSLLFSNTLSLTWAFAMEDCQHHVLAITEKGNTTKQARHDCCQAQNQDSCQVCPHCEHGFFSFPATNHNKPLQIPVSTRAIAFNSPLIFHFSTPELPPPLS